MDSDTQNCFANFVQYLVMIMEICYHGATCCYIVQAAII